MHITRGILLKKIKRNLKEILKKKTLFPGRKKGKIK